MLLVLFWRFEWLDGRSSVYQVHREGVTDIGQRAERKWLRLAGGTLSGFAVVKSLTPTRMAPILDSLIDSIFSERK